MLNGLCADTQPANIGNKNGNAILTEPVLSSFKEAGKEDVHRPVTGLLPHRVEMAEVKARAAELSKLYQQKK